VSRYTIDCPMCTKQITSALILNWYKLENHNSRSWFCLEKQKNFQNHVCTCCIRIQNWVSKSMTIQSSRVCAIYHFHKLLWCVNVILTSYLTTGKSSDDKFWNILIALLPNWVYAAWFPTLSFLSDQYHFLPVQSEQQELQICASSLQIFTNSVNSAHTNLRWMNCDTAGKQSLYSTIQTWMRHNSASLLGWTNPRTPFSLFVRTTLQSFVWILYTDEPQESIQTSTYKISA
jgi:hypothetical protein